MGQHVASEAGHTASTNDIYDQIKIQDGAVSVGKIMCDPEKPEYLKSQIALTVSCPLEIADCMIW
jgi:hypothetical protein